MVKPAPAQTGVEQPRLRTAVRVRVVGTNERRILLPPPTLRRHRPSPPAPRRADLREALPRGRRRLHRRRRCVRAGGTVGVLGCVVKASSQPPLRPGWSSHAYGRQSECGWCARAGPTPPVAPPTSCVRRWGGCATAGPGDNSRCGPTAASTPNCRCRLPGNGCPLLYHHPPARQPAGPDRGDTRGGLDSHSLLDGRRRRCRRDDVHPVPDQAGRRARRWCA